MDALMVFQVSSNTAEVANAMRGAGYHSAWSSNNKVYNLPDNCVWRPECELEVAKKDLIAMIEKMNASASQNPKITLTRCVVVPSNPWAGLESGSLAQVIS